MSYDPTDFNPSRLFSYAKKVAKEKQSTPVSTIPVVVTRKQKKGWFSSVFVSEENLLPLEGWVLLVNPAEGEVVLTETGFDEMTTRGFEEGSLLMLTREGLLVSSDYRLELNIFYRDGVRQGGYTVTGLNFVEVSKVGLISFDHLNRFVYRKRKLSKGELMKTSLGRNFRARVPHPGMETSLALKRFLESGSYVETLGIKY